MRLLRHFLFLILILSFYSCSSTSEETEPVLPDPQNEVQVKGNVESIKGGNLMAQSGTTTKGKIDLVFDEAGNYFLHLGEDFMSEFYTGTVTVYLSTNKQLRLSETGTFQLVSVVNESGEHFFPLPNLPESKFNYGIIWCGAAGIPFGYGSLD